jgi:large subunit ribosomal protein L23
MDLTIYDVIKGPIITDKAYKLNNTLKQLVVEVHMDANKARVKEALEKLFNVKVDKVRVSIRKGKKRLSSKKRPIIGKKIKKAIVSLKDGYNIDVLGQTGNDVVPHEITQQLKKA